MEVSAYLDVTSQVNLSPCVCVQRVLVAIEPTGVEPDLATVLAESDCLRSGAKRVLDVHIVHAKVVLVNANGTTCVVRTSYSGVNTSLNRNLVR